jgi:hypothetical protein
MPGEAFVSFARLSAVPRRPSRSAQEGAGAAASFSHFHPWDEAFNVLDGEVEFSCGGTQSSNSNTHSHSYSHIRADTGRNAEGQSKDWMVPQGTSLYN